MKSSSLLPLMFSPQAWGRTVFTQLLYLARRRFPHRRGDEPRFLKVILQWLEVFPTGVGMNRSNQPSLRPPSRFPHRRGDEPPGCLSPDEMYPFSPQAWG